jgi:hypothetical protein
MTEPTFADLLAGVIDLAPSGSPPHPPGPCSALCVPACTGRPAVRLPVVPEPLTDRSPLAPVMAGLPA